MNELAICYLIGLVIALYVFWFGAFRLKGIREEAEGEEAIAVGAYAFIAFLLSVLWPLIAICALLYGILWVIGTLLGGVE